MSIKKKILLCGVLFALHAGAHCLYDAVSLDGAWEMAYRPYAWDRTECPQFKGYPVRNAIPGYWEDMREEFRAAGIKDDFAVNPMYMKHSHPIIGWAYDTTFPDIYGNFFYRRTVAVDKPGRAFIFFEGVRNEVRVWVNGIFVAFRQGFSTPFELEIPEGILKAGENEIVLAVANRPNTGYAGAFVSGLSTRSVFVSTGGVNGHVELRFLRNEMSSVYVTTSADLKNFTVHVDGGMEFAYEIKDGTRVVRAGKARGDFTLPTAGLCFWSPEDPKRYELVLKTPQGEYARKFGLRRMTADGEGLLLNGRPVYLRGVTEHCYFAQTIHLPRDIDTYRKITGIRKELGFNFVRFHTYIPPAEYLEAMDELGMLVHLEAPNFVTIDEYRSIIEFARHHPSVVIYCTGNETRIDMLAEKYLREVASIVHSETDALFSPMSAMRSVEYAFMKGLDRTVSKPFPHNPDRMARLAEFCDLFTSYQLGAVSYNSLNGASAEKIDEWGDAYCGKPRLSHEICIDGGYADLSLEKKYPADSPIVKAGIFSGIREVLSAKGLLDRAPAYHVNSCEWMRRIRKFTFEKMRASRRTAGYDFLGDINTHWHTFGYTVGMMDEFFRLKPGETAEDVRMYNSAAVLFTDLGSDFIVKAGKKKRVKLSVSNYAGDARDATLRVSLDGVWSETRKVGNIRCGSVAAIGEFDVAVPVTDVPVKYTLSAKFSGGTVNAENKWEIWAFPETPGKKDPEGVKIVENISADELTAAMERGEKLLLFGAGPFNSLPTTYRIGLAGRCRGNYATVIKKGHPALAGLPHEGFCGWEFRRLMEDGKAVQLEAGIPFDPVIDVASSDKYPIRQSALFEYRVGKGRLLACSFKFRDTDPAAVWLKAKLKEYAASEAFDPKTAITSTQLRAVIEAPILTGEANRNRARNPNDPSSTVRAGYFARP